MNNERENRGIRELIQRVDTMQFDLSQAQAAIRTIVTERSRNADSNLTLEAMADIDEISTIIGLYRIQYGDALCITDSNVAPLMRALSEHNPYSNIRFYNALVPQVLESLERQPIPDLEDDPEKLRNHAWSTIMTALSVHF